MKGKNPEDLILPATYIFSQAQRSPPHLGPSTAGYHLDVPFSTLGLGAGANGALYHCVWMSAQEKMMGTEEREQKSLKREKVSCCWRQQS